MLVNVGLVKAGVADAYGLVAELVAGYLLQNGRGDVLRHREVALGVQPCPESFVGSVVVESM